MSSLAIIMMVSVQGLFTVMCGYFFYKVLTTPPKMEPDSFSENDDVPISERQQ